MPPRLPTLLSHLHPRRLFHSSAHPEPTHYDTLSLPPTASTTEIKKRFYELSKAHHPDRNRHDPHASRKFTRITGAYSILSNAESRRRYDRDVLPASTRAGVTTHNGPVGSRPASGLSRRRTQWKGPPPSYYRRGAFGGHGVRGAAGAGLGEDSVPGFNFGRKREQHEREEVRRAQREIKKSGNGHVIDMSGFWSAGSVFLVLVMTVYGTYWAREERVPVDKRGLKREDRGI